MAIEVGASYVTILPSAKGFGKNLNKQIGPAMQRAGDEGGQSFGSKFGGSVKKWGKRSLIGIGVTAGALLGTALTTGFSRSVKIENAQAKLKGLGYNKKAISGIMDDALSSVTGTAFGLDEAVTVSSGALAAGITDIEGYLKSVGDVSTITGKGFEETGAIFNKIASNNRVSGEEMNQLADAGIPILKLIQDEYKVTAQEARDMVSDGKIDAATFQSLMGEYEGAAAESGKTTMGAFANMRASLARFGQTLLQDIFPIIGPVFGALTGWIDKAAKAIGPLIAAVSGKASAVIGAFFAQIRSGEGIGGRFVGLFNRVKATAASAFGYIGSTVLPAVRGFFAQMQSGEGVGGRFSAFLRTVGTLFVQVAGWARNNLFPVLKELAGTILTRLGSMLKFVGNVLVSFGKWFNDNRATISAVAGTIGNVLTTAINKLRVVLGFVVDTALRFGNAIRSNRELINALAIGIGAGAIALGAYKTVMTAVRIGTKAWALVQGLLNKVMKANPIGLVIVAIGLLVAGLAYAYQKHAGFRNLVQDVWAKIKSAALVAVSWFRNSALPMMQAVLAGIGNKLTWLWKNIFKPYFTFMWNMAKSVFSWIKNSGVPLVGSALSSIANKLTWLWKNIFKPYFTFIWNMAKSVFGWMKNTGVPLVRSAFDSIATKAKWLYNNGIKPTFTNVKDKVSAVFGWLKNSAWPMARDIFNNLSTKAKWLYSNGIKPAFDNVKSRVRSTWDSVKTTFDALKTGISKVKGAFETAKDGIATAWNKVRSVVAKPIVAVLNFVNDGIIGGINKVLGWAGVSKIGKISIPGSLINAASNFRGNVSRNGRGSGRGTGVGGYASGGILPGYSPGKDDHFFSGSNFDLALAGGEAIMRPEFTRAVGPEWVNQMNAAARSGGIERVRDTLGYKDGGVFSPKTGGSIADVFGALKGAVKGMYGFIKNPLKTIKDLFGKGLNAISNNPLFDFAKGAIGKIAGGAKDKLLSYFGGDSSGTIAKGATGRNARGMPWRSIWSMIKSVAPEARMTSNYRAGAITASGYKSFHGMGRAVDLVSSNMSSTFEKIRGLLPWSELYYSPKGGRQLNKARSYVPQGVTKRMHYDHIHGAYSLGGMIPDLHDGGGEIQPGLSLVSNRTNRPERVLTDKQWTDIKSGGTQTVINVNGIKYDSAGEVADELLFAMRRNDKGKYNRRRR